MKIKIAQLVVTRDIQNNLAKVLPVLDNARENEWFLFPEGMISGYYPEENDFLSRLSVNQDQIQNAIETISKIVTQKNITCLIGSAILENDAWYNCSLYLGPNEKIVYKKNNLSTLDRNHFTQGNKLTVYSKDNTNFGIQMCRELAFPEQWKLLKKQGAKIIFHINNAIQGTDKVRENVLISRAFENQIWVCSVNNAEKPQTMSSMIIDPFGNVVWKSTPQKEEIGAVEIDTSKTYDQYLKQERTDLVDVVAQ